MSVYRLTGRLDKPRNWFPVPVCHITEITHRAVKGEEEKRKGRAEHVLALVLVVNKKWIVFILISILFLFLYLFIV